MTAEHSERGLVAAVLVFPDMAGEIVLKCASTADDFEIPTCREVWKVAKEFAEDSKPFDLSLIIQVLESRGLLESLGGAHEVRGLSNCDDTPVAWASHDANVLNASRQRTARTLTAALASALEAGEPSQEIIEQLGLITAPRSTSRTDLASQIADHVDLLQRRYAGDIPMISTGFAKLDQKTAGLHRGSLNIIAAETSAGKSALMLQMAAAMAVAGNSVAIYQLEMTVGDTLDRLVAHLGQVPLSQLKDPRQMSAATFSVVSTTLANIQKLPLRITEHLATLDEICADFRARPADVAVVDYIQIVETTSRPMREQEVAMISRRLKRMAIATKSVVITGSQLNDDGKLRESRAIGQDGDVVLSLTRDDEDDEKATVKVCKARNGQRYSTVEMRFDGLLQTFHEL